MALGEQNPVYGPFFGVMGAASAIIFSGIYQY
jgi:V-type H+-transporting ATPase proteolipid subunit